MARYALVVIPGELEPLEKAQRVDHPAGTSKVRAKASTNNPTPAGHAERMKFAKMAMERMIGSSAPEDEGKYAPQKKTEHHGREKGQKPPHDNYSKTASGMNSQAHANFGRRTVVVKPSELGSSAPESATAHQPKRVPKPKS